MGTRISYQCKGIFSAAASDILQIENYSLGYKLFYHLRKFAVGTNHFVIGGHIRFQVMESSDSATLNRWKKNRDDVYLGSSQHLFRSIVTRKLKSEGFELYRDDTGSEDIIRLPNFMGNIGKEITDYGITDLEYDQSVPSQYKIRFPSRLEVHYLNKVDEPRIYRNVIHPVSWIETNNKDFLIINEQGMILNPDDMVLSGYMSEARVAELLPMNFIPSPREHKFQRPTSVDVHKPVNVLSYLLERPYLHTDKSYYYPNETIWFRAYVNYAAPVYKDSLSHVLYVDLVDAANNTVTAKIFPVPNGSAYGDLVLPSTVQGEDYVLKAYTRWMLNFDSTLLFAKPIKILAYTEVGKLKDNNPGPVNILDITVSPSIEVAKDTFETRERITVDIGVKDILENFIPSNFSIAVTDVQQAVPASNETTILRDFVFSSIQLLACP